MLKESFKELQKLLLSETINFYGDRLVSLVVFGSAARETQRFDSDIDILVIAKNLPQGRMKRVEEFEAVEKRVEPFLEELKKEGINSIISTVIKSPLEAEEGSPLFLDMVEDAIILYDRDDFFACILNRLRKRLEELGAKRIWKGSSWYWDLKPDYNSGDFIEI